MVKKVFPWLGKIRVGPNSVRVVRNRGFLPVLLFPNLGLWGVFGGSLRKRGQGYRRGLNSFYLWERKTGLRACRGLKGFDTCSFFTSEGCVLNPQF